MNISKSQKKKKQIHMKYYNFFVLIKRIRKKKKRPIKDKLQIENADMRIIKWLHKFHNRSYATNC